MSQNVIELNGKRYDAMTGKVLGVSHASVVEPLGPSVRQAKVIDGFIRPAQDMSRAAPAPKVATKPKTAQAAAPKKATPSRAHQTAKHATAHHPEHAKTLMRRVVHKPEASLKPKIKTQAPAELAPKTPSAIAVKHSVQQVDPHRQARAASVVKHGAVRHFQPARPEIARAVLPTYHQAQKPVPIIAVKPAPVEHHQAHPPHKDMFESAIAHATSHQQPAPKRVRRSRHRRLVNTMAGLGAFLVIGIFFAWLNLPNLQLHVASVQAGFKAQMPEFRPTGYALQGGVQRFGNTVTMSYKSGASHFRLTQQPSDWNSQTLLENTLALSGQHETVQINGRIVYIYGESNAAWVDRGVRYDLSGNASLNTDDITHLVASL